MTLTKAKIVERIYSSTYFSKRESGELFETMLDIIKESLCAGDNVKIAGLGQFTVKQKAGRMGRNPQSGDRMRIQSRKVVTFNPSKNPEERCYRSLRPPYRQKRLREHPYPLTH